MITVKLKFNDIESSVNKAVSYLNSGSSAIMINSSEMTCKQIIEFCNKIRKYIELPVILLENSNNINLSESQLINIGVRVVIYTNSLIECTKKAISDKIKLLLKV